MTTMKTCRIAVLALVLAALAAVPARAGEPLGLNLDLGAYSAYLFRGANVFQKDSNMDQAAFLAPSATYTLGSTGLSVGYWGAFQVLGEDISPKIDAGLGAEQDLILGYGRALTDTLSLKATLIYYFFPLADEKAAGTSLPSYLEPGVACTWTGPVDLTLGVAYYHGVQDALKLYRYLYLNPKASKTLALSGTTSLELSLGLGYKLFNEGDKVTDNVWDGLALVGVPINMGSYYVKPGLGLAWTDYEARDLADEVSFFAGVNLGTNL
jgi:hypothetical protein